MSSSGTFRVQRQSRAYFSVMGVTIGMLIAGLLVPLAFGRTPAAVQAGTGTTGDLTFSGEQGSALPGQPGGRGALTTGRSGKLTGATVGAGGAGAPSASDGSGLGAGDSASDPSASGGSAPVASGPLSASDQGVTASSIKLGVVILDIEALKPLGFAQPRFSPDEQREMAQVYIDGINRSGGILGREIVPAFVTLNALDSNGSASPGAVCTKLAEDEKVFAVIGYLNQATECLTQQHGIPSFMDSSRIQESYTKSRNFLVSPRASGERNGANWGDLAARSGLLEGRTIGTLYLDGPEGELPEAALTSGLAEAGYEVAYHGKLSADQGSSQSQMPLVVNEMQRVGVDTVFLSLNFVSALQFVQTAERSGFRPQYHVSDQGSLTAEGLVGSMPESFNGAIAFTQGTSGSNESAADTACRAEFNKATGEDVKPGTDSGSLRQFCWWARAFRAGATAAGATLTRVGLAAAMQKLGRLALPGNLGGSFATGKTDFADNYRPMRFDSSCRCYRDAGSTQPGRY